jgi:hypothetical protein
MNNELYFEYQEFVMMIVIRLKCYLFLEFKKIKSSLRSLLLLPLRFRLLMLTPPVRQVQAPFTDKMTKATPNPSQQHNMKAFARSKIAIA